MGNKLFGVNISGLIKQHVAPGLLPVVITRDAYGARDPDNLTGGQAKTVAPVTGVRGFWDKLPRTPPPGVEFEQNDRIALLIGDTIPAGGKPRKNDAITIAGHTLYMVQLVENDPADATFAYLCRDRKSPAE